MLSSKPTKEVPPHGLLYIGQREMAVVAPEDGNMSRLMTKPTKDCASSEDSDQPGHPPSLISLRCALSG